MRKQTVVLVVLESEEEHQEAVADSFGEHVGVFPESEEYTDEKGSLTKVSAEVVYAYKV